MKALWQRIGIRPAGSNVSVTHGASDLLGSSEGEDNLGLARLLGLLATVRFLRTACRNVRWLSLRPLHLVQFSCAGLEQGAEVVGWSIGSRKISFLHRADADDPLTDSPHLGGDGWPALRGPLNPLQVVAGHGRPELAP